MQETDSALILIVDDDERNRKLLDVFMRADGYRTIIAANGRDALAMVSKTPPDLVLLDMMMPGMDGFEVARVIKADALTRSIPVIVVSSLDDIASRQRMLSVGANEVLVKPVDRWVLSELVRKFIQADAGSDA